MAIRVYTIARPRNNIPLSAVRHFSVTFFLRSILGITPSLDVLWRQNGTLRWLNHAFLVTRGRVS